MTESILCLRTIEMTSTGWVPVMTLNILQYTLLHKSSGPVLYNNIPEKKSISRVKLKVNAKTIIQGL